MLHRLVLLPPFQSQSELTLIDPGCACPIAYPVSNERRRPQYPPAERFAQRRGDSGAQAGLDVLAIGGGRVGPAPVPLKRGEQRVVGDPRIAPLRIGITGITRPHPLFGPAPESSTDGVEMDVSADGPKG
jgi:hypothetical protein